MVSGKELESPLLTDRRHRFIEPASAYVRYVATVRRLSAGTAHQYASCLLNFCNYLARKLALSKDSPATSLGKAKTVSEALLVIEDAHLKEWMEEQERRGNEVLTINQRLDAVFLFHIWMEIHGYVSHAVRIPGVNDNERFTPRLSSRPAKRNAQGRRPSKYGIVSDLRMADQGREMLPTPDDADMTKLYAACARLYKNRSAERNQLMMRWYQQRGLRRFEWAALYVDQLPSRAAVVEHRAKFAAVHLGLLKTKGGKKQSMRVLPELFEQTFEYIDGERAEIVSSFRNKQEDYVEPREIFLSSKTGKAMNRRSISNILRRIFDEAGVEGHGHRIRAHFIESAGNAEADADELAVLSSGGRKAGMDLQGVAVRQAEHARVRSVETLKAYDANLRKQRMREPEQKEYVTLQQAVQAKKQEVEILDIKLAGMRKEAAELAAMRTPQGGSKEPRGKLVRSAARGRKAAQK